MAEIVSIIGITHNPFMPRLFQQPQQPPGAAKVKERIAMMRQKLADAKPDVLVCIGNDHLHQFFMDNMPAFMIGKMEQYDGTFYDEEREFGLPKCKLAGDVEVSDAIMEGAVERVRPKMMTVIAIIAGLLPILWGTGTGASVMKRIAAPMVGGMVSSTVLTLVVIPAVYALWKERETVPSRAVAPVGVGDPARA